LILKLLKRQAGSAVPSGSMSKELQGFKVKASEFGSFCHTCPALPALAAGRNRHAP
jgi:hypothetical protein